MPLWPKQTTQVGMWCFLIWYWVRPFAFLSGWFWTTNRFRVTNSEQSRERILANRQRGFIALLGCTKVQYLPVRTQVYSCHRPQTITEPIQSVKASTNNDCCQTTKICSIFVWVHTYDITYKNTKDHTNADALSRLPLTEEKDDLGDPTDIFYNEHFQDLPITIQVSLFGKKHRKIKCYLEFWTWCGRDIFQSLMMIGSNHINKGRPSWMFTRVVSYGVIA